jgi:hypothetical protein
LRRPGGDNYLVNSADTGAFDHFSRSPKALVEIVDYLLVTADSLEGPGPAGRNDPVHLPAGIRMECLDQGFTERLLDAAQPRGEDWEATRQFGVAHAYVRTVWKEADGLDPDEPFQWDHERRLYPCVQLSRLVRDNAVGTEYAIRLLRCRDGSERLVPFAGYESHVAYRLHPEERGWLDHDEADELARLLECYWDAVPLPDRVGRGLRRVDLVTRERYLEDALPVAVGAAEALLKIGRTSLKAQFAGRVSKLASEQGIGLDVESCGEIWEDRSALVHGSAVDLAEPGELDRFGRSFVALQETLRCTVREAIEDRSFAALFADDALIEQRWPTTRAARTLT